MSPVGRATPSYRLYGRLADGASIASATSEFAVIARRDTVAGVAAEAMVHRVLGFTQMAAKPGVTWGLWLTVAALVLLLLVSAANVANLLLARAAAPGFEFAVRSALGASRTRIAGQLILDATFVAAAAAVIGAWGAQGALQWLRAAVNDFPYWIDLSLGWRAVFFVAALALGASVVVAVVPVNRVLRAPLAGTMKDGQSLCDSAA
jgi:ABC-type antimicrobial peptide transport system permease subunit